MNKQRFAKVHRVSGSVQIGAVEVVIDAEHADGTRTYRVIAPILPHYGNMPHEGAEWTLQHGRGGRTKAELERDFAPSSFGLFSYEGSAVGYPYYRHPIQQHTY
jgi:hypothetical protein